MAKSMKRILLFLSIVLVALIIIVVAYFSVVFLPKLGKVDTSIVETRLESCQNLVLDLDELLAETDEDYSKFVEMVYDWQVYNISDDKFSEEIELMMSDWERRHFRYENTLDKYNAKCFEISKW